MRKTITVIKLGGKVLTEEKRKNFLLKEIVALSKKERIVLVHGGGPEITRTLEKFGIKSRFIQGQRYTDEKTLEFVEMILSGKINKDLAVRINKFAGKAVGLSGKDCRMVIAEKIKNLGLVGKLKSIDPSLLELLIKNKIIPVISSIATDENGNSLNINADIFAEKIAGALKAEKLILLTDTPGVLDQEGKTIPLVQIKQITELVKKKVVSQGMIPKLQSAQEAIREGVKKVFITDGRKGFCSGTEIR